MPIQVLSFSCNHDIFRSKQLQMCPSGTPLRSVPSVRLFANAVTTASNHKLVCFFETHHYRYIPLGIWRRKLRSGRQGQHLPMSLPSSPYQPSYYHHSQYCDCHQCHLHQLCISIMTSIMPYSSSNCSMRVQMHNVGWSHYKGAGSQAG